MTQDQYMLCGIAVCILLAFLIVGLHRKAKKKKATAAINRPKAPPPLPGRNATGLPSRRGDLRLPDSSVLRTPIRLNPDPLDYPKCPLDRRCNEPGKPQTVFWNSTKKCYVCSYGHEFTGRE